MNQSQLAEFAAFVLHVGFGIMYLAHSVLLKLMAITLAGTAAFFIKVRLPGWLAYLTFVAEAVGGVLPILGIQSRWVALALMLALVGAIIWVHVVNGWVFTAPSGGWEYPAFLIVATVAQVVLGDGAYALSRSLPLSRPSAATA